MCLGSSLVELERTNVTLAWLGCAELNAIHVTQRKERQFPALRIEEGIKQIIIFTLPIWA